MRNVLKNFGIAFGIFALIVFVGTCVFNNQTASPPIQTDTSYVKVLHKNQVSFNKAYEKQINLLKHAKDSLINLVSNNKNMLSKYRVKSKALEQKLITLLTKQDSSRIVNDSISPLSQIYFGIQEQRDSASNQSVTALEVLGVKRDSVIIIQNQEKENYRALQKEQEQRALQLTEQLNTAYKQQKKVLLKSRILTGTLILISGFSSALLINQTLK